MIRVSIIIVLLFVLFFERKRSEMFKGYYETELIVTKEYTEYTQELKSTIKQYDSKLNSCYSIAYLAQKEQLSCYNEIRQYKKWAEEIQRQCKKGL